MNIQKRYSPEFRERAVRLVDEQVKSGQAQWAVMQSISAKLGCMAETLRRWLRRVERDDVLKPEIRRVWEENFREVGPSFAKKDGWTSRLVFRAFTLV